MRIGLTGGIASGKSTVSHMFREKSIPVVDADIAAREVVEPGEIAYKEIIDYFGREILLDDGGIDRKALGGRIFKNEEERLKLNQIVHPQVRKRILEKVANYEEEGREFIVLDIPLLIESKLTDWVDQVLVVYVPFNVQLARLMERDRLSEEDAMSRINAQLSLEKKRDLADVVIDNSGAIDDTKQQLEMVLKNWREN